MKNYPFDSPGKFFRGNLHAHSNNSDGVLNPKELFQRYRSAGYDFVSITDHMVGMYGYPITDTRPLRDKMFTTLLGAELHTGAMANGEIWHLLAVGLPLDFKRPKSPNFSPNKGQESGNDLAIRAVEAGAFVALAHPQWSGLTLEDAMGISGAHAVEVYNHGCAVDCDRPDGFAIFDLLLSKNRNLTAIATDDSHFKSRDYFGGWVMVKAEQNRPELLLDALKRGSFYSSQGPQIYDIDVSKKEVAVRCSPVSTVIVQGEGTATTCTHGARITAASLPLGRCNDSNWIRITIVDSKGKRAWTNPYWL